MKNALDYRENALEYSKHALEYSKNALEYSQNALGYNNNAVEYNKNASEYIRNALKTELFLQTLSVASTGKPRLGPRPRNSNRFLPQAPIRYPWDT